MKVYRRESGISAIVRSKLTTILLIGLLVMSATLASVGAGEKPGETTNVIPKGYQAVDGEPMKIQTQIISLDFSKPTLQEMGAHMKVTVKEAESFILNPTAPMLPMKTITLKLPFKTKVISVELAPELLTEELRTDKLVAPFPKPRPLCYCMCADATEEIELDEKIYRSSELYPAKWFDYKLTAGIDPSTDEIKNFLTISFYPARYSPKTSIIQYATIAELIIKYMEPLGPPLGNPSYDMVIITPTSFYTQLSNLTIHKDNHGIMTKLVNLTDVYSGTYFPVQGSDNPERIKYFIKNATEDWGITYVLLGGDSDQFPVRTIYMPDTLPDDGDDGPTDLYYADLFNGSGAFSSWNFDGDGIWGERLDDNVDIRPDVYIGRLPASTSTEMDLLVNKIITYETTAYGQSWFNNATFVGSDTFDTSPGGIPEGEMENEFLTTNYMSPMGFNVTNLYETDFYTHDGYATRQNVTNTIDAGTGFVNFANHGDYNGVIYCTLGTPVIRNVDAFGLTNGDKLPFVYADACLTNGFDNASIDSLSEKFMLAPNGGAIGYIGSTRVGWGINDNFHIQATSGYMDVRTWRAYYFGQETPARMLAQAQNDFVDNQNPLNNNLSYKTVVQNMLLGDPSLKLGGYPGLAITYPSNGDFVAGTVNITGIASGTIPTEYVEVKIDSGLWNLATGNTTWYYYWDTIPILDGLHTIYARGWNGTSFSNATPVNVNVDNTKPTSSVSAQPTYQTTLTFPINYARDDGAGSGIRNITLYYRFNLAGGWIQYGIDMPADGIMVFMAGSDGFYEFYSRAYDNVGNFEDAPPGNDTWTTVDTQKPTSSVDALLAYTTTSMFNVDATVLPDANGIQIVELWYNNGTGWIKYLPDDTIPPYSWSFDTATTGDGVYQFYSRTYDNPGNYEDAPVGNDTWTLVDTKKPISSIAPLPMYTTTSSFTVDAAASDITSGVKNVTLWYGKDGAIPVLYSTDNAPPWSFNFDTLATGGDGVYEFYSRAYDNVNHYEDAPAGNDTWTIVDTQKPSSSVNALPVYTAISAFNVDVTVIPDANGIQMVELWYNKDAAGDVFYAADFSAPWSFNFNTLTTGGDGTYEFFSIAYDGAGNVENVPIAPDTSTMVDTQKPSSSADSLPLYTTIPSFILSATASDVMSGVQQVELWYSKDGGAYQLYATDTASPWSFNFDTSTTGGDGTYGFYSQAYDNANNYETAPPANDTWTIVDTQKPSSSVESLPAYTTTAIFTITVAVSDLTSGVQQVELWYNKDSTGYVLYDTNIFPPWSFNFDTSTTGGDGTYEFYSMANDSAGFTENLPVGPDASTIVDTQKPTSSVNSLDDYTTTASFIIIVTASDLESGLQKVELWYNKDYTGYVLYENDTISPWAFNFNTSTTGGEGFYEFYSLAYDKASNLEDTPIPLVADESIIVDMIPPQIQITSPSEGEWLTSSAVVVDWFGSDSLSGMEHYETKIDLGSWIPKGTGLQHTFTGLFEGSHIISVRAFDAATNENATSLTINIDLLPPVLTIISPTNNSKANSSTMVVTWTGSDSSSGINHYEIKLDYGFYVSVGLNQTHTFYNLTNGTHKFTVKAVDNTSKVTESFTTIDVELEVKVEDKGDMFDAIRGIFVDYWWAWLILLVSIVIIVIAFVATRRRKKKGKEVEAPKAKPPSQPKTSKPSASQPSKPQAPKKSQTPKPPQAKQPQKPQSPPPQSSPQSSKPSPQPPKT